MAYSYFINDGQRNPNILINGDMSIAQRGTSVSVGIGATYIVDRWSAAATAASVFTMSQQSGSGISGLNNFLRIQRNSGSTSTAFTVISQPVESLVSKRYQGKNLTFSFWIRAGTNFSAAGSAITVQFLAGTGTDQNPVSSGFTGVSVLNSNTSVTLTTSWQRVVVMGLIPSTATELAPVFTFNPTGTAGANDYFDITGVMITEGGLQDYRNAGSTFDEELAACQRFYEKSYEYGISPGTTGANQGLTFRGISPSTAGLVRVAVPYKVNKRVAPSSVAIYSSTSGAIGTYDYNGSTASSSGVAAGTSSHSIWFEVNPTITANTSFTYGFNFTADAEIY